MSWMARAGHTAWLATLLVAGCSKGGDPAAAGTSASASASAAAAPRAPPSASASVPAPAPMAGCRAVRVSGEAKVGEAPLASGSLLDGETWVTLAKGAKVSLKHTSTGRELEVSGPALFRACRRGREQLLLARGSVLVGASMGSRPGAEVLIATPVAGVRYGEADFTLTLDDKKLKLAVRTGRVELDPQPPKPVKSPLSAKDTLVLPLGKPDPKALMALCQEAAQAAEASGRRVGDRSAPEPLGERAQAHVKARRLARTACTVAAASTGLVADPVASAGLWAEAARWEGLWESIPRRERGQGPEK